MSVYKYLDLSTAHVTELEMGALNSRPETGVSNGLPRHIPHEYGAWMHVPEEDPMSGDEDEEARTEAYPSIQRCIEFARDHDCFWINFDQDAEIDPALPTHDW